MMYLFDSYSYYFAMTWQTRRSKCSKMAKVSALACRASAARWFSHSLAPFVIAAQDGAPSGVDFFVFVLCSGQ